MWISNTEIKFAKNNLWDSSIWKMRIVLTIQISGFLSQECPWVIGTWIRFKISLHFVSDFDLENECKEICHETTIECISNCTTPDSSCISKCSREEITCFNSCPCESDCPLGCVECNHSICETKRETVLVLRSVFRNLLIINYDPFLEFGNWSKYIFSK